MATPRYRLGRHWMREYHKFFPISPPEEDYEDRNLLYAMYALSPTPLSSLSLTSCNRSGHFCASTLYGDKNNFRKMYVSRRPLPL